MKFIYCLVSILLSISFGVYSQSFFLSNVDGSAINNGDTILLTGTTSDNEIRGYIVLMNNASSTKTVKLKKTELSVVPGTANAFAWDGDEYPPFTMFSMGNAIAPLATDSSFTSFFLPQLIPGISFIQYTFFDQDNPADSGWVVIEYQVMQVSAIAGINIPSINIFPNPANGIVTIILSETGIKEIPVRVYNSVGETVYADFVHQGKISFDVADFPDGYYMIEADHVRLKLLKQ
jgi:hypothetical protein